MIKYIQVYFILILNLYIIIYILLFLYEKIIKLFIRKKVILLNLVIKTSIIF